MTQRIPVLMLAAACVIACGKYGPPVRSAPQAEAGVDAEAPAEARPADPAEAGEPADPELDEEES